MASPTQWTWVRINSRGWPGVLQSIGLQRARHDWATELTEQNEKRTLSQTVRTSTATLPSVQFSSVAQSCPTLCDPWTAVCKAFLVIINPQSLLKLMSLSQWFHPIISSSVVPFSSHFESFSASGSFQMSQLSASGGQSREFTEIWKLFCRLSVECFFCKKRHSYILSEKRTSFKDKLWEFWFFPYQNLHQSSLCLCPSYPQNCNSALSLSLGCRLVNKKFKGEIMEINILNFLPHFVFTKHRQVALCFYLLLVPAR